jgi:hypothetical protein
MKRRTAHECAAEILFFGDPTSTAWAGCAAARPGTPGKAKARHSQHDPDGALPAKLRKAKEGLRPVGRVRAAQQRAWGYGDPATRALETADDEARRPSEANASFKPSNDIEFSGERKRVRCNEGLGVP